MKIYLQAILLIIFLSLFSCKEKTPETNVEIAEKKQEVTLKDSIDNPPKPIIPQHYEYYYVSAKSGLNYRKSPRGKVLGKFPLNTELKIVEHTNIPDEIKDDGKTITGKWLGIEQEKDTVYVFEGFLSASLTYSESKIYAARWYYDYGDEIVEGFINLSESYPWDYETDALTILPKRKLGKDTVQFDSYLKDKFLKKMSISTRDTAFIYNLRTDSVYKFKVNDLPVTASINVYLRGRKNVKEQDYEIGFDLGNSYDVTGENFVYIGKENPFVTGKIKRLIWESTDNERFPSKENKEKNLEKLNTFKYTINNLDYFLQVSAEGLGSYHLVVVDKTLASIVFDNHYFNGESTNVRPINSKDDDGAQWTGKIFKNKPSIVYGLMYSSFECPKIEFTNKTELPIRILCDNRY